MKFFKTIYIICSLVSLLVSAYLSYFFDKNWIFTTFLIVYAIFTAILLIVKGDLFMKKKNKEMVKKNGKAQKKKAKEEPQDLSATAEPPEQNSNDEQAGKKGINPIIPDDVKSAFLVDTEDVPGNDLDSEEDSEDDSEEETREDFEPEPTKSEPEPTKGEVRRGTSRPKPTRRAEEIRESPDIEELKDEINELQKQIDEKKVKILNSLGVN